MSTNSSTGFRPATSVYMRGQVYVPQIELQALNVEITALRAEIDRLREERDKFHDALEHIAAGDFAALAAENERLREALKKATDKLERAMVLVGSDPEFAAICVGEFRAALAKEAGK
jgi:SMC interacting uncharacterized protein involved in chromosome segregation